LTGRGGKAEVALEDGVRKYLIMDKHFYVDSGGAKMKPNKSRVGVETVIGGVRPYRTIRGRLDGSSENGKPLNTVNGLIHP